MKVSTIIDPNTGKRTDRTEYPVAAIRELIINALVHRDYSIHTDSAPITIRMFSDRFEIENPCGSAQKPGIMCHKQFGYETSLALLE